MANLVYDDITYSAFIEDTIKSRGEEFVLNRTPPQLYGFFAESLFMKNLNNDAEILHTSSVDPFSPYDFEIKDVHVNYYIDVKTYDKSAKTVTISDNERKWLLRQDEPYLVQYVIFEHDAAMKVFNFITVMNGVDVRQRWNHGMYPPNSMFIWVSDVKKFKDEND